MLNKSGILFPPPLLPKRPSLQKLNHSTTKLLESKLNGSTLASFPPRTLRQILKIIENGSPEAVSIMEWLYVFKSSEDWMFNDKADQFRACVLIWETIAKDNNVSQMAFFKAALALDLNDGSFPQALIDTAYIAKPLLKPLIQKKVEWIEFLSKSDYLMCAKSSYKAEMTVKQYIYQLSLPDAAKYVAEIYQELVSCIDDGLSVKSESWLLQCIRESPSTDLVIRVVNDYLALNPTMVKNDSFDTWFEKKCLPEVENSYYLRLNANSKRKLKNLYRISEYYKFQKLISLITEPKIAKTLKISPENIQQLNDRTKFWSNYSDSFIQVKIIIPVQTEMQLKQSYLTLENYELLESTEDENSEVCIFEFDNMIIVELFRGSLSETRFFKKTERNVNRLLRNDKLSIADIRDMAEDEVHDHVVGWQYYCENLLRRIFNIIPNTESLPRPFLKLREEREAKLDIWMASFWDREYLTNKYKGISRVQFNLDREFDDLVKKKSLFDMVTYTNKLTNLANNDHSGATYLLAVHYLSYPRTAMKRGKETLIKAIKLGNEEAIKLNLKYNFEIPGSNHNFDESTKQDDVKPIVDIIEELIRKNRPMLSGSLLYDAINDLLSLITITSSVDNHSPLKVLMQLSEDNLKRLVDALIVNNEKVKITKLKAFLEFHSSMAHISLCVNRINDYFIDDKYQSISSQERTYLKLSAMEITKKVKEFEKFKNFNELLTLLEEVKQRNTKAARTIQQNIEFILRGFGIRF